MNNPFHQHHWVSVGTHYTASKDPKSLGFDDVKLGNNDESMAVLYGSTRIYQKCEGCGLVQESVVLGHYKERDVEETTN